MAQTAEEVGNAILQRQEKHLNNFLEYIPNLGLKGLDHLLANPESLDDALVKYIEHLILTGQFEMNFSSLLVDLRSVIFTKSEQKIDIEVINMFPKTSEFRYLLDGTPLKEYHIANIFVLLQNLSNLMTPSLSIPEFYTNLAKIPKKWQANYNALVQYGVMFIILYIFDVENLEEMKKSNLAKIQVKSKSTGQVCQTYWILKTHKDAGKIPFSYNKLGFNPGLFVENYYKKLDGNRDLLFQIPLMINETSRVWYKDMLLPGNYNFALNELASICGLKKNLTIQDFKNARQVFKKNLFFMNFRVVKKTVVKRKADSGDPLPTKDPLTTVHSSIDIKREKMSDDESEEPPPALPLDVKLEVPEEPKEDPKDQEIAELKVRVRKLEGQLKIKDEALKHLKALHDEQKMHYQNVNKCIDRTTNIFKFMDARKNGKTD